MDPNPAAPSNPSLSLDAIALVLGDANRLQLLIELAKGTPLPVAELARRLRAPATNISKHVAVLRRCGVIQHSGFGQDYRIADKCLVPGERAIDLGTVVLRLGEVA